MMRMTNVCRTPLIFYHPNQTMNEPVIEPQPILRRSTRERRPVDHYGIWQSHSVIHSEPSTLAEAKNRQDKVKWMEATDKEMISLENNDVWQLTTLPKGKSVVSCKWVYKVNTNADGSVERHKTRLVARGFSQEFGSDYDETFSPVVRHETRIIENPLISIWTDTSSC